MRIRTLLEGEVVSTLVDVDGVLAGDDVLERRTLLAGLKGQQRYPKYSDVELSSRAHRLRSGSLEIPRSKQHANSSAQRAASETAATASAPTDIMSTRCWVPLRPVEPTPSTASSLHSLLSLLRQCLSFPLVRDASGRCPSSSVLQQSALRNPSTSDFRHFKTLRARHRSVRDFD